MGIWEREGVCGECRVWTAIYEGKECVENAECGECRVWTAIYEGKKGITLTQKKKKKKKKEIKKEERDQIIISLDWCLIWTPVNQANSFFYSLH